MASPPALLIGVPLALYAAKAVRDWRTEKQLATRDDEIIALMNIPDGADFHQTVDRVRTFINDHSQDKIDAAFHAMNGDGVAFADGVIAHARDPSRERVHMECSTRANLTGRVLAAAGLRDSHHRLVQDQGSLSPRTAFSTCSIPSPSVGRRSMPTTTSIGRVLSSGDRVSLAEAAGNLDAIVPCGRERAAGTSRSHDGNSPKSLVELLDILSVTSKENDVRYSVYTPRADLDRIFTSRARAGHIAKFLPSAAATASARSTQRPSNRLEAEALAREFWRRPRPATRLIVPRDALTGDCGPLLKSVSPSEWPAKDGNQSAKSPGHGRCPGQVFLYVGQRQGLKAHSIPMELMAITA